MSQTVIKVENLSKQYRLGTVGTGTISHDLNRWWHKVRGKEDPYLKIGESNDRASKGESEYVWALKDINFEVKQGEVLGIIGKNGAGKSTLLKILSKVTGPTTGSIKAKGRIASLLEVGTGFHPELTGRENIYLNGTILGMTKAEVTQKLDEIVDFAGVARYLDTPVKRYSSGMKVRLGFAVAAHLEPEILVVDEVLAVGDAEFQKKAIGKMQEVSQEGGRTVLFVSHNMTSIESLCDNTIVVSEGEIGYSGKTKDAIQHYLKDNGSIGVMDEINLEKRAGSGEGKLIDIKINSNNSRENSFVSAGDTVYFNFKFDSKLNHRDHRFDFRVDSLDGARLLWFSTSLKNNSWDGHDLTFKVDDFMLNIGKYKMTTCLYNREHILDLVEDIIMFQINSGDFYKSGRTAPSRQSRVLVDFELC